MKMNDTEVSYIVYRFMVEVLDLSSGNLAVYAIIYSFAKGNNGLFYGSKDYLARSANISLSTAKNALKYLLGCGYIVKCTCNGRTGYRVVSEPESIGMGNKKDNTEKPSSKNAGKSIGQVGGGKAPCHREKNGAVADIGSSCAKIGDAGAAFGRTSLPVLNKNASQRVEKALKEAQISAKYDDRDIIDILEEAPEHPKYDFCTVGINEIVQMTPAQYEKLLTLVKPEVLFAYVRRLELLICDKGYKTFSPYKTVRKWITEDAEV